MATVAPRGNLDQSAQSAQMRIGLVALAVALGVAIFFAHSGGAAGYRALAFVPFFVAGYGVLSAFYGVCGFTALAGRRMTAEGSELVADRSELSRQRMYGLRVIVMSVLLAGVATALFISAA